MHVVSVLLNEKSENEPNHVASLRPINGTIPAPETHFTPLPPQMSPSPQKSPEY